MSTLDERWERFLDPDIVRSELFSAAMYITTFEILTDTIEDRIRDFYVHGWNADGPIVDPGYQPEVLSRNRSPVYASLSWLRENRVIGEEDLRLFEELKKIRNDIAHELFRVVTGQKESNHADRFVDLVYLLKKIEVWWVLEVEIPTNPDFADKEIDASGVVPGTILSLQMLLDVASGNTALLDQWRKLRARRTPD